MKLEADRWLLLDVEGTTSSIAFVYDVMFPYARREVDAYLKSHLAETETQAAIERLARDQGLPDASSWREADSDTLRGHVVRTVHAMMDADSKATGLKAIQGLIWKAGFDSGELVSHLFDDVVPALQRWQELGLGMAIYSSGSVVAQKLFFGHTSFGDLTPYFQFHFDTTVGPKKESRSYVVIAEQLNASPSSIVFLSDVEAELEAASQAGMKAVAVIRPGNKPLTEACGFPRIASFDELNLQ